MQINAVILGCNERSLLVERLVESFAEVNSTTVFQSTVNMGKSKVVIESEGEGSCKTCNSMVRILRQHLEVMEDERGECEKEVENRV